MQDKSDKRASFNIIMQTYLGIMQRYQRHVMYIEMKSVGGFSSIQSREVRNCFDVWVGGQRVL
jgi:hypothetical protein